MITIWKETKLRCNPHARYTAPDGTKHIKVPVDLYEEIAEPVLPEDYSPDTYDRLEVDAYPYVVYARKDPAELAAQVQRNTNATSLAYLSSTDWYVTRFAEVAVPIPPDVLEARAAARASIIKE